MALYYTKTKTLYILAHMGYNVNKITIKYNI